MLEASFTQTIMYKEKEKANTLETGHVGHRLLQERRLAGRR